MSDPQEETGIVLFENREIEKINKADKGLVADHVWSSCRPSPKFSSGSPMVTAKRIYMVRLELQNNPRLLETWRAEATQGEDHKEEYEEDDKSESSSSGGSSCKNAGSKKSTSPSEEEFHQHGRCNFSQKSLTSDQCPNTSRSSSSRRKVSGMPSECSMAERESETSFSPQEDSSDFCQENLSCYECAEPEDDNVHKKSCNDYEETEHQQICQHLHDDEEETDEEYEKVRK